MYLYFFENCPRTVYLYLFTFPSPRNRWGERDCERTCLLTQYTKALSTSLTDSAKTP